MARRGNNTGDSSGGGADPDSLDTAAAEWFFRRDRGLTAEEAAAFDRWLAADPRHAATFAEIEESWASMGHLSELLSPSRLSERASAPSSARIHWLRIAASTMAAAAALAVGFLLWSGPSAPKGAAPEAITTTRTETRRVLLPDGSSVQLNRDSAIIQDFTARQRGIRLVRGEAHFTVTKDPSRPFVVRAAEVDVRAVGTAFNVRLGTATLEVVVTEGVVRLATPKKNTSESELASGQMAIIPVGQAKPTIAVANVAPAQMAQTLAWRARRLEYADASLADIVADFNRYNAHQLKIEDPALAARRFGAAFPVDDYDSLVRLLESTFGVVAERRENVTVLRLR